jgi:hypothetical protein
LKIGKYRGKYKYVGKTRGENTNMWRKYEGKIRGENTRGKYEGKIQGDNTNSWKSTVKYRENTGKSTIK